MSILLSQNSDFVIQGVLNGQCTQFWCIFKSFSEKLLGIFRQKVLYQIFEQF